MLRIGELGWFTPCWEATIFPSLVTRATPDCLTPKGLHGSMAFERDCTVSYRGLSVAGQYMQGRSGLFAMQGVTTFNDDRTS